MDNPDAVFVLDACALLRFAQAEPGMDRVKELLYAAQRGECRLLMHQINLGEVLYLVGKRFGWSVAERKHTEIGLLPLAIVPFDDTLFWQAVQLKARFPISYADAFAAALALDRNATLVTADPEFEALGSTLRRLPI